MGTDYDGNGFSQGDDGAVYGNPSDTGSISDYDSWDWKQIEAAIRGMSAGTDDADNLGRAASVASPQSLQDAANAFYHVQMVLSGVARALQDQAKALAGDDGPWKGDAADAFHDMMTTFSKQVGATADVLSGGKSADGGGGSGNSVPQQLADNAVNLLNAQNKIGEIDAWYANQATLMGVTPMSNGLIPVSKKPELVKMLNRDMRAVLKNLAAHYQVTIDTVRPPGTITGPGAGDPPPIDEPPADEPPADYRPTDYQPADVADLANSGDLGLTPPLTAESLTSPAGFDPAQDAMPSPYSGSLDTNGPGSGLGGDGDVSGLGGPGPDGGLGGDNSTLDPSALDRMLNPSAFGGGTGLGGDGSLGGDSGFGGLDGLGPDSFARSTTPAPFGGGTGLDGAGGLGGGPGLGGLPPISPGAFGGGTGLDGSGTLPGSDLAEDPATWKDGATAADFPGGTGIGGGSGLGDLGLGSGSGLGGLGDSKGFVPSAFPGSAGTGLGGSVPSAGDLGLETETPGFTPAGFPGSTGLSSDGSGVVGGVGGGMPFMPGMGGGGQSAAGGFDRSDASGLLDPNAEPWTGEYDPASGEPVAAGTAPAGQGGLDLPGALSQEPEAVVQGGAPGMMMPGMGGGAPGGAGREEGTSSDASGLLAPSADPWTEPGLPEAEASGLPPAATGGADTLSGLPEGTGTGTLSGLLGGTGTPSGPADGTETGAGGAPVPVGADGSAERFAAPAVAEEAAVPAAAPFLPMGGMGAAGGSGRGDEDDPGTLVEPTAEEFAEPVAPGALAADALAAGTAAPAVPEIPAHGGEEQYAAYDGSGGAEETGDPLVVLRPADDDLSEEDTAAWGVAGASFVPLLWAARPEEEAEVTAPGYATADDGTWGAGPAGASRGADASAETETEEQPLATWRPNRAAATGEPGVLPPTEQPLSCAAASADDEWEEEEPEAAGDESAEEEPASRGIADLLVQEGDTWGSPAADGPSAVY
ncbi:WXG100 family type VII secretion target [Streptomyces sp. IBSBF 2435]|uniref:WXG100 family type VII secretion target n=1 Tax=Streptomyces sp. IBSBF 2435 TaxID=2903531 RepID=UPI002FDC3355